MKRPIYLDYQATTPLAPEALAAMQPWFAEGFANPHSPHAPGRAAAAAVDVARDVILHALRADAGRLLFTSGATEAANLALQGAVRAAQGSTRRKVVTIAIEHACVLDTALWLGSEGYEVIVLPVGRDGLVDLAEARAAIDETTLIVAAMLVNNEIGVIQPVAALADLAHAAGALFFCDAVQGFGRVALPIERCDMVALSGHKLYGPKGVGALWLRDDKMIAPILHGGGQEAQLRSGTLSPALCAGFGAAVSLAEARREADAQHVSALFDIARDKLKGWTLNGSAEARYHGNLNIRREGLDAARLISELRGVAFSAGSACASGSGRPSHVLSAIGLSRAEALGSIRLGFGRYTTQEELAHALDQINSAADRQRGIR